MRLNAPNKTEKVHNFKNLERPLENVKEALFNRKNITPLLALAWAINSNLPGHCFLNMK